jgi:hypothetical protein
VSRRRPIAALALACLPLAAPLAAQVPHLDPLPWPDAADTLTARTLEVSWDRFDDGRNGWAADRVGLAGLLSAGGRARLFLRMHFLNLDTAERTALERWPQLAGEDADEGWPGESQVAGFGRPEVGLIGPLRLPLLGTGRYGLALGLPVGRDQLYPLSAASMPFRLAWRRDLSPGGSWRAAITGELLQHMDSAREYLEADAFASGHVLSGELGLRGGSRRGLLLCWRETRVEGRTSSLAGLWAWLPWGERHALGLAVQRELGGTAGRPFETLVTLTWRLVAAPPEETAPAPAAGRGAPGRGSP